ncbi:hypothetical protein DIC66_03090 [Rhodoferax lacus]|uniref:Type II secretion system protein H n=1 Tax=Rhodoferax lacus TaxID=2184758 RepID=A0A3E1RJX9_9BURK|nr:GspH/FimT family pseudopilin [Rhodoferax lacus]RFO98870.1 hypothetical protein DIC66_03090 [Rhodoferax lacus]
MSHKPNYTGQQKGVTPVEMLTTLAIACILAAVAMPSLSALVSDMRERSVAGALFTSLHRARNEAIHRNARVVICKSSTGLGCASKGGWHQGWIIFHDVNNNATLDAGETLIHTELLSPGNVSLTNNGRVEGYVSFTGEGLPRSVRLYILDETFTVCRQSVTQVTARQIKLSGPGNIRSVKSVVANCS